MILEQFDPSPSAVIDPTMIIPPMEGFPQTVVSCFSKHLFAKMVEAFEDAEIIAEFNSANLATPIYRVRYRDVQLGLCTAEVGAPACVGLFEEVYAMGAERIVLFGTCGVLDPDIHDCAVILPTSAMRDEGTSFHYAPPSDEIATNEQYRNLFEDLLQELKIPYHKGKVWTTDGVYRETRRKVEHRRAEGCIAVDMEASAMAAMAQFRGKGLLHFFYAADNLANSIWDPRSLSGQARIDDKYQIALVALEAGYRMEKGNNRETIFR